MTAAKLRQARRMHTEGVAPGELAKVLGVGRATVYRHLDAGPGKDTPIEDRASDPPVSVVQQGQAVLQASLTMSTMTSTQAPTRRGARTAGRHAWFVLEADGRNDQAPGAVLSRQTRQRAAKAALVKALGRRSAREPGAVLGVRSAEQIVTRLEWDAETRTCVVRAGPPGA